MPNYNDIYQTLSYRILFYLKLSVALGDSAQPEEANVQGVDTVATVENVDAIRK